MHRDTSELRNNYVMDMLTPPQLAVTCTLVQVPPWREAVELRLEIALRLFTWSRMLRPRFEFALPLSERGLLNN